MRIAISGTYSTGKTTTSLAVSYLTGVPHTSARTMRQLLPIAVPGKRLQECTPAEIAQLGIRRFVERATRESHLQDGFVSDGTSVNEWVYGKIRVRTGIDPNKAPLDRDVEKTDELRFFEDMVDNIGSAMKGYAADAYDAIFHLPVEFAIVTDGHRPVSERFRTLSDELLLSAFAELGLNYQVVGGTTEERLEKIVTALGAEPRMTVAEALHRLAAACPNEQLTVSLARRVIRTGEYARRVATPRSAGHPPPIRSPKEPVQAISATSSRASS